MLPDFRAALFQAARLQKALDLFETLAQSQVIDIAHDGGQARAQIGGKRNNQAGHEARLYSNLPRCQKNRYLTQKKWKPLILCVSRPCARADKNPGCM